ncbi:MAG: hypothetical protein J0G96_08990 [Flavobacteriia bacterium]|nr:hypothetical protein [Flavobacteriia bacterium]OJX36849.1 MAG: hypothetical protein BGO87_13780 [Flavobacteriia bacterium 40-80]
MRRIINIKTVVLFVLILFNNISFSQISISNSEKADSKGDMLCTVFISSGFENDTCDIISNECILYKNVILKSDDYSGLTGYIIEIDSGFNFHLVQEGKRNSATLNTLDKQCDSDNLSIGILINNKSYLYRINTDVDKYIVIYKRGEDIFFESFQKRPGFE